MFGLSSVESKIKAAQAASAAKAKALAHPQALKSKAQSKAPSLPGGKPPKGIAKGKGYTFTMGKLSLLAISLSLMVLGAFTFFSGFLVGAWYFDKTQPPQASFQPQGQAVGGGGGGVGVAGSSLSKEVASGAQGIGLGSLAGQSSAYQVQSAIESANIPGVPSFLQPFVEHVKDAVGMKAGAAAGRAVSGQVKKAEKSAATPPPAPAADSKVPSPSGASSGGSRSQASPVGSPSGGASSTAVSSPPSSLHGASPAASGGDTKSSSVQYSIQLGAYVAKENAETMLTALRHKNYDAYIKEGKESSGQPIFYVRVGHYTDYDMAHTVAVQFVDNNIPGATIVKVSDAKK